MRESGGSEDEAARQQQFGKGAAALVQRFGDQPGMACCKVVAADEQILSDADDGEQLDWSMLGEGRPPLPKGCRIVAPHQRHVHLVRADQAGDALLVRRPAHLSLAARQAIREDLSYPLAELERGRIGARSQDQQVAPAVDAPLAIGCVATKEHGCGAGRRRSEEFPAARPRAYLRTFGLMPHAISCGIWSSAGWRRLRSSARRRHCRYAGRRPRSPRHMPAPA